MTSYIVQGDFCSRRFLYICRNINKMEQDSVIDPELKSHILAKRKQDVKKFHELRDCNFDVLKLLAVIVFCISNDTDSEIINYFVLCLVAKKWENSHAFDKVVKRSRHLYDRAIFHLVSGGHFVNLAAIFGFDIAESLWKTITPYGSPIVPVIHVIESGDNDLFEKMLRTCHKACLGSVDKVKEIIEAIFKNHLQKTKSKRKMFKLVLNKQFDTITNISKVTVPIYVRTSRTSDIQTYYRSEILKGKIHGATHSALLEIGWLKEAKKYRKLLKGKGTFDATEIFKDYLCVGQKHETDMEAFFVKHNVDILRRFTDVQTGLVSSLLEMMTEKHLMYRYLYILYVMNLIDTNQKDNMLLKVIHTAGTYYEECPKLNKNMVLLYVAGENFKLKENVQHCHHCSEKQLFFNKIDDIICPYEGIEFSQQIEKELEEEMKRVRENKKEGIKEDKKEKQRVCFLGKNITKRTCPPTLLQFARKGVRDSMKPSINMFKVAAHWNRTGTLQLELCQYLLFNQFLDIWSN